MAKGNLTLTHAALQQIWLRKFSSFRVEMFDGSHTKLEYRARNLQPRAAH